MRTMLLIGVLEMLFWLNGCAPENACRRYGFQDGTVAMSQCVQNEVLAAQRRITS